LLSIPAYLSGEEAEHLVEHIIGVNKIAMDAHEDQAEIAFWILLMNGAIALGTLISAIKTQIISRPLLWINFVLLIIVVAFMARTGYTGGQIRHSEINARTPVELDDDH
jgi:hypothetical protein